MNQTIFKTKNFNDITNKMLETSVNRKWTSNHQQTDYTEVTFSFPDWTNLRADKYKTITTFNHQQKEVTRELLKQIESIAKIKFTEKKSLYDSHIKFGLYNNVNEIMNYSSPFVKGYAHYPSPYIKLENKLIKSVEDYSTSGSVWLNKSKMKEVGSIYKNLVKYDLKTKKLVYDKLSTDKELKNKIDLFNKVADDINYSLILIGDYYTLYENINKDSHLNNQNSYIEKGSLEAFVLLHESLHAVGITHTFNNNASLPYSPENSTQYSIMAYNSPKPEDADLKGINASTLLLTDIYVLQHLYGANLRTRTEDTTYGFNANTKNDIFYLKNAENKINICIWDAGGFDTLDFSGYKEDQKINLNQGQFSDVGGLRSNISIAYGTVIEKAIGGYGNDIIIGNGVDNFLDGKEGNDRLYGGYGRDILHGGKGSDLLHGGEDNDCLYDLYGNNRLYGGDGNDRITSGSGIDILHGGNGDDRLDPGANHDFLYGGDGKDLFEFELSPHNYGNNKIEDFNIHDDKLIFYTIENNQVQKSNIKIIDSFSGKVNEAILNYDKKENKTIIKINTEENKITPNLFITLNGYYSSEDLFLS